MSQDGIVAAGYSCRKAAFNSVVGGIVAFFVAGGIVFVLPVAILSLDLLESR
jgi:hypothetical protein